MTTFTIPRTCADRLSRLALACANETGPLGHIAVRVTPQAVRFAATNGRLLASLVVPLDAMTGEPIDTILDAEALTAALKATAKATGSRIAVDLGPTEARLTNGNASAIVRRVDGTYPRIDSAWTRTSGRRWLPTMSSLDPVLLATAQMISGSKQPLLFSSPVDPSIPLERLWAVPGAAADERLDLAGLRQAVTLPGYWADHLGLAILVMPVTRSAESPQLDLTGHAVALPEAAAVAA